MSREMEALTARLARPLNDNRSHETIKADEKARMWPFVEVLSTNVALSGAVRCVGLVTRSPPNCRCWLQTGRHFWSNQSDTLSSA